jgi:hypothetical protein
MHVGQCPTGGAGVTANTPASRKAKGRKFQQEIRDDLITSLDINPDDILSTAMGQGGCDLYLSPAARARFPYSVESKMQEQVALWSWWKQCEANASKVGLVPLLVFKRNREEPLAVLRWSDLLQLLTITNQSEISSSPDHRFENLAEGLTGGRV